MICKSICWVHRWRRCSNTSVPRK